MEVVRQRNGNLLRHAAIGGEQRGDLTPLSSGNGGTVGTDALARVAPHAVVAACTRVKIIVTIAPDGTLCAETAP